MGKKVYHIVDSETGEVVDNTSGSDTEASKEQPGTGKSTLIQFGQAYRESSTSGKIRLILFVIGIVCMLLTFVFLFFTVLLSKTMVSFWGITTIICCITSVICLLLCGIGIER